MANTNKYISLSKLSLYDEKIKKVISDGDDAKLQAAKNYADSLAPNYEAAGNAATEAGKVQSKLDEEISRAKAAESSNAAAAKKAQDEVDALELVVADKADTSALTQLSNKVGEVPADTTVMDIINNIQENAYDDSELRAMLTSLNTNKADKTQVASDIAAAVKTETDARVEAVSGVQRNVDTLSQTHATDKAALEASIATKADKAAYEQTAATLAEVKADVDAFFKDALGDSEAQQVKDTLKELQEYIASDESGAAAMAGNIQKNTDDIAALDGRLDTAESDIDKAEAAIGTLNGQVSSLQGAVATKVEQEAYNIKIQALEAADSNHVSRLEALEAKFEDGEGSVEDQIASAKQSAIETAAGDATAKANKALEDAKKYTDTEIDTVEGAITTLQGQVNSKAAQADLEALEARVETAEGEIDTLQSEMDAVEALAASNKAAHEANAAAIALLASQADLTAVANRVTALETWHNNFTEASEDDINGLFA